MNASIISDRLGALGRYGDTTPATIASIMSSFLWALCLAFPGTLIGPPGVGRPTYKYMYDVADEPTWIFIFSSIFLLQLWRIFCHQKVGNRLYVYLLEIGIKGWAAIIWTFIALACMIAQYPPAAAMSDAIVIAGLCWWDFLRCESRPDRCTNCFTRNCRTSCPYVIGAACHDSGNT